MAGLLAFVAFLLAWVFAMFGGPGPAFFHPLVLAFLGLALLALHVVFAWPLRFWQRGA
jgi:hypothetical protein